MDQRRRTRMLAIGLGAAAGGAVVLAIVNPRSLLLSRIDIFVWGVVLAIVAGVVALVDPATLARRTRRRLIEPPSFNPTVEPAAPRSDRSTAYAELWDEKPALPVAEADRWESFVGRPRGQPHRPRRPGPDRPLVRDAAPTPTPSPAAGAAGRSG